MQEVVETFHTVWRNCLPGEGIFVEVSGFDDLRTTSDSVTDGIGAATAKAISAAAPPHSLGGGR